jgi:hypothetical protein
MDGWIDGWMDDGCDNVSLLETDFFFYVLFFQPGH